MFPYCLNYEGKTPGFCRKLAHQLIFYPSFQLNCFYKSKNKKNTFNPTIKFIIYSTYL